MWQDDKSDAGVGLCLKRPFVVDPHCTMSLSVSSITWIHRSTLLSWACLSTRTASGRLLMCEHLAVSVLVYYSPSTSYSTKCFVLSAIRTRAACHTHFPLTSYSRQIVYKSCLFPTPFQMSMVISKTYWYTSHKKNQYKTYFLKITPPTWYCMTCSHRQTPL